MKATFLDFDGVIADSIEETFVVSLNIFYGFSGPDDLDSVRQLFFKYRGLVRPPHHFWALHSAIKSALIRGKALDYNQFRDIFFEAVEHCEIYKERFECLFFSLRKHLQLDKSYWVSLNPITEYGKSLVGRDLKDYYIVTTKDSLALDTLLSAYGIDVKVRFTKSDYEKHGSKGNIINSVMDSSGPYKSAIFVDDATEHLDTVDNSLVTCYFAHWGYGVNTNYNEFSQDKW